MQKIEDLRKSLSEVDQKRVSFENRIRELKLQMAQAVVENPESTTVKELSKTLKNAEDDLADLMRFHEAVSTGIKIAAKEAKRKIDRETLERNKSIVEQYRKSPPPCPRCGTNKNAVLLSPYPSHCLEFPDTPEILGLNFECSCHTGVRYSIGIENGRAVTGMQKSSR